MTGPVADQPVRPRTPPGVGTPLRADGRPGQRHPSSHDVPDWEEKNREVMDENPYARRTRTMGHPTHSPFKSTATGIEREREREKAH